ncbi:MAG: hypothetical protein WC483_05645 [Candidatus Paceibacterota bacterium]
MDAAFASELVALLQNPGWTAKSGCALLAVELWNAVIALQYLGPRGLASAFIPVTDRMPVTVTIHGRHVWHTVTFDWTASDGRARQFTVANEVMQRREKEMTALDAGLKLFTARRSGGALETFKA